MLNWSPETDIVHCTQPQDKSVKTSWFPFRLLHSSQTLPNSLKEVKKLVEFPLEWLKFGEFWQKITKTFPFPLGQLAT